MTPKEKANQLVDKFDNFDVLGENHNGFTAQQCALIAIDEMLKVGYYSDDKIYDYLHEVKKEIEKL